MDITSQEITRDIYGMPAFVTFTVSDLDQTIDWYVNGLDFIVLFSIPGPDGPSLVHLRRWRYQDILIRHGRAPTGGQWTYSIMAHVEQLDAIAERARGQADTVRLRAAVRLRRALGIDADAPGDGPRAAAIEERAEETRSARGCRALG